MGIAVGRKMLRRVQKSAPSRADLINAYWLSGLSLSETGQLYGLGYRAPNAYFSASAF